MVWNGQFSHLTFAFGLTGNIFSFMVFLSPLRTFYTFYKNKSTQEFQSTPYVVGLFTSILWIYYALLKGDAMLLIVIRFAGAVVQTFYLCIFILYAPKRARMESLKQITLFIVIGFGLIVLLTQFLMKGNQRDVIVGWIFLVLSSLCVFVAPLSVLRQVIKTESVKYISIRVSLFVMLSNVTWFIFGLLLGDFNILIPNTIGFTLDIIQIIFHFVYKNKKPAVDDKITGNKEQMIEETDEPGTSKVIKDENIIDVQVEPNECTHSEDDPNQHGQVAVVHSPTVASHTIEVPACD